MEEALLLQMGRGKRINQRMKASSVWKRRAWTVKVLLLRLCHGKPQRCSRARLKVASKRLIRLTSLVREVFVRKALTVEMEVILLRVSLGSRRRCSQPRLGSASSRILRLILLMRQTVIGKTLMVEVLLHAGLRSRQRSETFHLGFARNLLPRPLSQH